MLRLVLFLCLFTALCSVAKAQDRYTDTLVDARELFRGSYLLRAPIEATGTSFSYDNRVHDTRVKDQGREGLCTAFAVVAAMEHQSKYQFSQVRDLSEMHLWSLYEEYQTDLAIKAATRNYVTLESIWPYLSKGPVAPMKYITKIASYRSAETWTEVYKHLQGGRSAVLSVEVNESWQSPVNGYIRPGGAVLGGHAVHISGYFSNGGGNYLIIKNSWGPLYGDKGYVYLPASYCRSYWCAIHLVYGVVR